MDGNRRDEESFSHVFMTESRNCSRHWVVPKTPLPFCTHLHNLSDFSLSKMSATKLLNFGSAEGGGFGRLCL